MYSLHLFSVPIGTGFAAPWGHPLPLLGFRPMPPDHFNGRQVCACARGPGVRGGGGLVGLRAQAAAARLPGAPGLRVYGFGFESPAAGHGVAVRPRRVAAHERDSILQRFPEMKAERVVGGDRDRVVGGRCGGKHLTHRYPRRVIRIVSGQSECRSPLACSFVTSFISEVLSPLR